jgi:hypothetical protein
LEKIFGGFDKLSLAVTGAGEAKSEYTCYEYGLIINGMSAPSSCHIRTPTNTAEAISHNIFRSLSQSDYRQIGVATEIYNEIVEVLRQNCAYLNGSFVEYRDLDSYHYCVRSNAMCFGKENDNMPCLTTFQNATSPQGQFNTIAYDYAFQENEDICPASYKNIVDTKSWGICSCWHNGGRRVQPGSSKCAVYIPNPSGKYKLSDGTEIMGHDEVFTNTSGQVCPSTINLSGECECPLWSTSGKNNCEEVD